MLNRSKSEPTENNNWGAIRLNVRDARRNNAQQLPDWSEGQGEGELARMLKEALSVESLRQLFGLKREFKGKIGRKRAEEGEREWEKDREGLGHVWALSLRVGEPRVGRARGLIMQDKEQKEDFFEKNKGLTETGERFWRPSFAGRSWD
ncbi:hypothetical protein KQX54_018934 [Cotesia glomerata]|uniref:Uncharacterized protein n=1 Tax=Cotesia glomerata TaxID=32391 RepID=A0AAV7IAX7_COTGL|nr:hypothetical protein KQX54_018934 [Cotesia glomerata]